jgi:DNA-binding GntR family transcriptional regulator
MANRNAATATTRSSLPLNDRGPESQIYERIHAAIVRQQLPPGTRLREDEMRKIFGVSRARVRAALSRLAFMGIVTLEPNRGASVTKPSPKEAREVFAARRAIEAAVVQDVARRIGAKDKAMLQTHIKREQAAELRRDHDEMIQLSGEFHLLLAQISQNDIFQKFLAELITRESLVIAAYEAPGRPSCSIHEHQLILDALIRNDPQTAEAMMREHMENVESRLDLDRESRPAVDLAKLFG